MTISMRKLSALRIAAAALALLLAAGVARAQVAGEPWELLPPVFGDTAASCIDLGDDAVCFGLTCRESALEAWFLGVGDWSEALVVETVGGAFETPEARVHHLPLEPDEEATAHSGFPIMTAPASETLVSDIVAASLVRVAPLTDGRGAWMYFSGDGALAATAALERRCVPAMP